MMPIYKDHTQQHIKTNSEVEHLTLKDYIDFVEKFVKSNDVLRDEDAKSFIIEELIVKNQSFVPGIMPLESYMKYWTRYALKNRRRLIARHEKKREKGKAVRCPNSYIDFEIIDNPSDGMIVEEEREIIRQLIPRAGLDSVECSCIYFTLENYNLEQISKLIDIPACTLSRKLKNAKKKLKDIWELENHE